MMKARVISNNLYLATAMIIFSFSVQATSPSPAIFSDSAFTQSPLVGNVFYDNNGDGIKNTDEEGIAGVRLASISGLVVETDGYGRFHIPNSNTQEQNFILKLDVSSLPAGAKLTTENPRIIRQSISGLNKVNFGIQF